MHTSTSWCNSMDAPGFALVGEFHEGNRLNDFIGFAINCSCSSQCVGSFAPASRLSVIKFKHVDGPYSVTDQAVIPA